MFNKLLDLNQLKEGKPPVLHVEHSFLLYHVPFGQPRAGCAAFLNLKMVTATGETMDSTWAELGRAAAASACRVSERNASCLI